MTSPDKMTFEEFLEVRLRCKSDTFYLGKHIFENDFAHCHEVWRDFFPKFDPQHCPPTTPRSSSLTGWVSSPR